MSYKLPYGFNLQNQANEKSALHKNDTKKVRLSKSQYKEDGLTPYAKEHATIKPANFWRKSEKAVISVPKEDFYSSKSKLINSPTTFHNPTDERETTSMEEAYSWDSKKRVPMTGAAPTAYHQKKQNIKENIKLGAVLGGAATVWHRMSGGKWII